MPILDHAVIDSTSYDFRDADAQTQLVTKADAIRATANGPVAHFVDGAVAPMGLDIAINPVQEAGEITPTTPRAISGWTGAKVKRTGKNLVDDSIKGQIENYIFIGTTDTDYQTSISAYLKAGTYTVSVETFNGENTNLYVGYKGVNSYFARETSNKKLTFTLAQDAEIRIWAYRSGYSEQGTSVITSAQLELGSTATPYEPYQGADYSITLPNDAGTVYGGILHVNEDGTGTLTVKYKCINMGDITWNYYTQGTIPCFRTATQSDYSDLKQVGVSGSPVVLLCSCYTPMQTSIGSNVFRDTSYDKQICCIQNSKAIWIQDSAYTDVSTFTAAVAGQKIIRELETPVSYNLTAAQISSLFGENNVWADTGDVTAEYTADTKTYIERLTQPDDDMVSDSNISIGKFFMVGNTLYISTSSIAAGETIVPGTNCTKISLAQALNNINA